MYIYSVYSEGTVSWFPVFVQFCLFSLTKLKSLPDPMFPIMHRGSRAGRDVLSWDHRQGHGPLLDR